MDAPFSMAVDRSFVMICPDGACFVILFWYNNITQGRCPYCGEIGEDLGRIEATPNPRRIEIEAREHPVGRRGIRKVTDSSGVLHEDMGGLECSGDHDSEEKR